MHCLLMPEDDGAETVKMFLEQAFQSVGKAMIFEMDAKTRDSLVLVRGLLLSRLRELWGQLEPFPDEAFREQLERVLRGGETQ